MATLENTTKEQIRRLLDLFPANALKEDWVALKGFKKDDICEIIAKNPDIERIRAFLIASFTKCRRHTLILEENAAINPIIAFPDAHPLKVLGANDTLYLSSISYAVFIQDPMEKVSVEVLWPVRVQTTNGVTIVSSVVLEREPETFTGRQTIRAVRVIDDKQVTSEIQALGLKAVDLNKGVKALWAEGYMDAFRTKYKKTKSLTTEIMDGELGIRENDPALYQDMLGRPMFNTLFRVATEVGNSVGIFQIDPTSGKIGFTSYTGNQGDADEIVQAILGKNI